MGCTASKPVSPGEKPDKKIAEGDHSHAANGGWMDKSPSANKKGNINVNVYTDEANAWGEKQENSFTAAVREKGSTRARRLSYITPDQAMLNKLRAEYDKFGAPGSPDGSNHQPVVFPAEAANRQQQEQIQLKVASMCMTGQEDGFKKVCQDANFAYDTFIAEGTGQALFGAMDGHGPQGHLVAGRLKRHLPHILAERIVKGGELQQAMVTGFLQADQMLASSGVDCQYSGSTCSVAYLHGSQLTVAWVGDSRVVLGRQTGNTRFTAQDLSVDHKPTTQEEKNRILKSGGRIERCLNGEGDAVGPFRVWVKDAWVPGLAMSRSLGDQIAHTVGVSSEPSVIQYQLTPSDKFMVLASDGVWEFMSSQEVVDLVSKCKSVDDAAHKLVTEAYKRWLEEEEGVVDDITAVVVGLQHKGKQ